MSKVKKSLLTLLVILSLLFCWAFFIEPASFSVHHQTLSIKKWPKECSGKKIALLADLHVGSPHIGLQKLADIVKEVNTLEPDLILLLGDYVIQGVVGGTFITPEKAATELGALRAPLGVYAVLGNHDWWLNANRVSTALTQNNIKVLEDASQTLQDGECRLQLVGISDFWEGAHNIAKAMHGIDAKRNVVAFTHNPDVFAQFNKQMMLTLAGHTHGGQVHIPGIGRPIVPSQYGEKYAIGHVVENGKHLYVSPGVGTSILPVRFLVPPQIDLLTITP